MIPPELARHERTIAGLFDAVKDCCHFITRRLVTIPGSSHQKSDGIVGNVGLNYQMRSNQLKKANNAGCVRQLQTVNAVAASMHGRPDRLGRKKVADRIEYGSGALNHARHHLWFATAPGLNGNVALPIEKASNVSRGHKRNYTAPNPMCAKRLAQGALPLEFSA